MSHPRISAFASSANGNAPAARVIEGQATLQGRTDHEIGLDALHDEIVAANPFAQAILIFRGGASGEEAPVRVIQGPKTQLGYTDNVTVDGVYGEIYTAQFRTDAILVYSREPAGDTPPIRIIHGPKTKLDRPERISVDPVNDLLAVTTIQGLWIFNRTDNGDVAPKWIIAGPKTGIGGEGRHLATVVLSPEGKKIIATGEREGSSVDGAQRGSFVGVWNYGDNGDVRPWAILNASKATKMVRASSLALNPSQKELILISAGDILFYHLPEVFQ